MKTATYTGNVIIVFDASHGRDDPLILLGRKKPKKKIDDEKRSRKKIGQGLWVPPGGATEPSDKSQKHAAQRELREEAGLVFPQRSFRKAGILRGYADLSADPLWLVHIYIVDATYLGQLILPNEEYEDMHWFHLTLLPFDKMFSGDSDWLPRVVKGEKLSIKVLNRINSNDAVLVSLEPTRFN